MQSVKELSTTVGPCHAWVHIHAAHCRGGSGQESSRSGFGSFACCTDLPATVIWLPWCGVLLQVEVSNHGLLNCVNVFVRSDHEDVAIEQCERRLRADFAPVPQGRCVNGKARRPNGAD